MSPAIAVHLEQLGDAFSSGRFASSTMLTASISMTLVICAAATSLTLLAICWATFGSVSVTVIATIRVSVGVSTAILFLKSSYFISAMFMFFFTVSST